MSDIKMVIIAREDLKMRKGKLAAQAGHAASALFTRHIIFSGTGPAFNGRVHGLNEDIAEWVETGTKKIVVGVEAEQQLLELETACRRAGLRVERIVDSGLTEFHGVPTLTCIAIGPADASLIDPFTRHLKLL